MSYCTFASEVAPDVLSDVQVYAEDRSWVIMVATHRRVSDEPMPALPLGLIEGQRPLHEQDFEALNQAVEQRRAWVSRAGSARIGGPSDGQVFEATSPQQCAQRLEELSKQGYRVPLRVITLLHAEQLVLEPLDNAGDTTP